MSQKSPPTRRPRMRDLYTRWGGPENYYRLLGEGYINPHAKDVREIVLLSMDAWREQMDLTSFMDLACGGGEVTLALCELGLAPVLGVDPFTSRLYEQQTACACVTATFQDVAKGVWAPPARVGTTYCSYALHLLQKSWLPQFMQIMLSHTNNFVVIGPTAYPAIAPQWGWHLASVIEHGKAVARLYDSISH